MTSLIGRQAVVVGAGIGGLAAARALSDPKTEGPRPDDLRQRLEFGEALNHLAAQDAAIHKLLIDVLHLLKPQSVLANLKSSSA
jgi:hypothetical protein